LRNNERSHSLDIAPKAVGVGSSVNGGELLLLALATCYRNDLHREPAKRGIRVEGVEVEVHGDLGAEGEPAKNVTYRAKVMAEAREDVNRDLMRDTNEAAEIQNTVRVETPVLLSQLEAARVS